MPLTPDKTYKANGLLIKQYFLSEHNTNKINIPTTKRKKTVAITIHNTAAIETSSNTTAAEQYTRATINGNMKDVRVHYYVDETCAWQNLNDYIINWSCADGTTNPNSGNNTSIAIEIIGNSAKAEENGAKLAAYLLNKYGLSLETGLRTHTYWLNIKDGKKGTIDQINVANNSYKNCLPIDSTELLTPNGWKGLREITTNDYVAQYDKGVITFVKPIGIVEPYKAKTLKTRNLEATDNHRMLVTSYNNKKEYEDKLWENILSKKTAYKMKTSGFLEGKLDISDNELLLISWIQGDGHYMKNNNGEIIGIEFHLKKERKIRRIHELLNELKISYTDSWCKNGSVHIRVYNRKLYEWAETWLENKVFTYKMLSMSKEQFNIFLEELFIIDGHMNERQKLYTSTVLKNLNFIQALCATHETRSSLLTLGSSKKRYGNQPTCVNILRTDASFHKNNDIKERETMVSCVTVPSSYILIRQNNHTFIVGNCPIYIIPHWSTFKNKVKSYMSAGGAVNSNVTNKNENLSVNNVNQQKKENDVNVTYQVYTKKKWLPAVKNLDDYAGIIGSPISCLAVKPSQGKIKYRVHQLGSYWMNWITEYNLNDLVKGYAGVNGIKIDAIQIKFEGIPGYDVKYRVSPVGGDYYPWVIGDSDYAGVPKQAIDRIQIEIIKK